MIAPREGFEPTTVRLEGACSIQLSYRDINGSGDRIRTCIRTAYETGHLPLICTPVYLVTSVRFELTVPRLKVACITWLCYEVKMVRVRGFEPPTSRFQAEPSTKLSLHPDIVPEVGLEPTSARFMRPAICL